MVVLPSRLINRHDICNAIIPSLEEDISNRLNYSGLYEKVKLRLGSHVSHRDFWSCLKSMVDRKMLDRKEENTGKVIPTVYYSLTASAKKESRFDILGIDSLKKKRRKLYQLLFFFQAIKPPKLVSARKFNKALSSLSISRNNLSVETHVHILARAETNYKRVDDYKFRIVEVSDQGKKLTRYYYKHLGFSLKDIIQYIKKQQQKTTVDETKPIPFINHIRSTEATEEEIKKIFHTLREANLIRPTQNILDGYNGHITFIISDDSVQDLINKIWRIHDLEFEMLQKKWSYLEGPSKEEKEWLKLAYGDNEASMIIHDVSRFRKEYRKKNNNNNEHLAHMKVRIETLQDRIDQRITDINKKYRSVIQKFDFPLNILEDICMAKIFSKST
jgi:hypothetical protein